MNTFRRLTLFVTRYRGLAVIFGFAALLVLSLLLARSNVTGAAHAASGATSGNARTFTGSADICNNADPTKWKIDNLVGASWTVSNNTATYTFSSFVNENPSGGVPGLIEYCVYTTPSPNTGSVTASYDSWEPLEGTDKFSFIRPNGDPTNIPFDSSTQTVGKATWSAGVPTSQTILLHINDPAVCNKLYGGNPGTCFVLPGSPPQQAKDLTVSKTATPSFTRTYKWGIQKSVDKTEIDIADSTNGNSATFHYTVSVSYDSGTDSNWQVTGTITVNNPNGFDVSGVNVTDDGVNNGGSCSVSNGTNLTVPKNGSIQVSYTCTYSSAPNPSNGTNKATATWDGTKYNTPDSSASGSADFDFGSVSPKLVDNCVTVTDTLGGSLGKVCSTDASPKAFTYLHTVTGTAGTCVTQDNTATFTTNTTSTTGSASQTVKVCVGEDLKVSQTATPSFTRTYNWSIAKSVDNSLINIASGSSATFNYKVTVTETGFTDSGWQVTGQITVTNPNDWEAITANISDAVDNIVNNGGSCTVSGGMGVIVPANGSKVLNYTCTYTSAPGSSSGTNTATATWDSNAFFTPDNSASGSVGFAFTTPTTTVNQTINVTDTIGGFLGILTATDPPAPFTSQTFTYSHTVTNSPPGTCTTYPNTATIFETGQSSSQTVKVCVGADLTVSKTATPSFTRTYNWSIAKSVDKTLLDPGGTATYAVTVTETGFQDSAWQVTGNITVTNPNDWEAITANVSDAVDNDPNASCVVTGGTNLTLAASGNPGDTMTVPYTCTYSAAPASNSETNRATASWDKNAASTPNSSAQGSKTFAFTTPMMTVNKTITVTDTYVGTLGTVIATDSTPFTLQNFTYSRKFAPPASGCQAVNNTATIVQTGQSASASVKNCNSGALTMGFWQNKNGQGIISAADQTKLGNWLRQYHPFSDAPSTGLATYVYNIIKAANCSGTTCNPMLRAQMLATALDVYFSDPALGGNKIGAPAPIGSQTIDLTRICTDISTCTTFVNVSSAFGNATSLTVLQMLSYQNTADPAADAGAVWYNQVKATQVLAKDAFDAINNQVAFAP